MNDRPSLPAMVTGAQVSAIIPSTVEEMYRIGKMVVMAGLAPQSLVDKKNAEEATSAVCTAIMAGAELGLPPMVSLRSFTVIGGKPALYGDGLINVARRSRRAKRIQTGFSVSSFEKMVAAERVTDDEEGRDAFAKMSPDEKAIGWCVAERSDTLEARTEIFSIADAKRAGLWDERQTVRRKGRNGDFYDAKNDAPWHRYAHRMLAWRAAGYCLRELFADVLGGVTDEFEAREIAGRSGYAIDHDEGNATQASLTPPSPPSPPSPDAPKEEAGSSETANGNGSASAEDEADGGQEPDEQDGFDFGDYFQRMEEAVNGANDEASVEEAWNDFDPGATFQDDPDSMELAHNIKTKRLAQLSTINGG